MQQLTHSLIENKVHLKGMFGSSTDFYTKDIEIGGVSCCICMFECLSSIEHLWVIMLDDLSKSNSVLPKKDPQALYSHLLKHTSIPFEHNSVITFDDACSILTAGMTLILIDGVDRGLVLSTQAMQFRSVSEPSGEGNVRGPREGFVEIARINVSLVRRLIRTDGLMVETTTAGTRTKTEVALLYDRNIVNSHLLQKIKQKIEQADLPFLFDSGYLAPFLQKGHFSFFQSVGYTERPATAAAKICEGKIVLIVNGSPFAMIIPYFFIENFQSLDDYSEKAYFASFIRLLKYAAFFLAIMLPGVFVSVANFTPEFLPPEMLYKVASAELATPLPLFAEMLLAIFLLELIREAGLRLPRPIGHSVSLVAALIIGDSAVSAGLLGIPVIIIAALTAVCTYVVPHLYEPVTVFRILFVLAGGLFGPIGIVSLFLFMILNLCSLNPFEIPYTSPISPISRSAFQDGIIRRNWRILSQNDFTVNDLSKEREES